MAERINTNAAALTGTPFSPTGDFSVQVEFPANSKAYVEVMGQVDAAAPWVSLGGLSISTVPPLRRWAKCPNVRLDLSGNAAGLTIKAWSGE